MRIRTGLGENKLYIGVSFFVIIVIVLTILFSTSDINPARIPLDVLGEEWFWDTDNSTKDESFLGLESFNSFTYRCDNDSFPAYVTISTMKKFFMMNEKDLIEETEDLILSKTMDQGIIIDKKTRIDGERTLKSGHKTMYFVYNGSLVSDDISEDIMIFGETWNCDKSRTSIVCVAVAQTSNQELDVKNNFSFWSKILRDPNGTFGIDVFIGSDGLIFNIVCH